MSVKPVKLTFSNKYLPILNWHNSTKKKPKNMNKRMTISDGIVT